MPSCRRLAIAALALAPLALASTPAAAQDGQPVRLDDLKGKWSLLFFGYTYCPDICPTTLAQLRQVKSELDRKSVV